MCWQIFGKQKERSLGLNNLKQVFAFWSFQTNDYYVYIALKIAIQI